MGSYEKHMRHWKNHRNDRFFQQSSSYGGSGESTQATEGQIQSVTARCFEKIAEEAKEGDFPLYIRICGDGYVSICDDKNLFGTRIESFEELIRFGKEYIYGNREETKGEEL